MDSNNAIWIAVAVAAIIIIGLIVFAALKSRKRRRVQEADRIRDEVHQKSQHVDQQAAITAETEAKARAAKAEADAKAAEAARLASTAAGHRDTLDSSREDLESRRAHADKLDPRVKNNRNDQQDQGAEGMRPDLTNRQEGAHRQDMHRPDVTGRPDAPNRPDATRR